MPNVPSPISNEMDQSPKGLLGMASGQSTSFGPPDLEQQFKNLPKSLTEFDKIIEYEGEKYVIPKTRTIKDFENMNTDIIPLRSFIDSTRERMLKKRADIKKADSIGNKAYFGFMDLLNNTTGRLFPNIRKENLEILGEMRQAQYVPPETRETVAEYFGTNKSSGGLVSLQQGRSTDVAGNIARSLSPQEELEKYGKVLTPEERLRVDAYEKEVQERKDSTRLFGGIRDAIREQEDELAIRRLESQERMEEGRARSRLPKILRDDLNTDSVTADDLQAQMEQQLLRDATATGTQNNVGLVEGANISDPAITPEVKPKTSVIEQIFDTSQQLGLPRVEIPRMTEEEKQRELGAYTLGTLAKAFGTTKNLGEAGAILGEGAMGLSALKRKQREDDIKVLSADRTQSVEDITLANTLLKTQLLQEQYAKQGDSNRVKSLEILQEEIKRLQDSIPDEETQKRIAKLSAQLDAELSKMFGAEALPMFQGM
tara:strand:+ start:1 stop:1455 length:1455 start_codon:yes stop_codon:yes gene_type:complete